MYMRFKELKSQLWLFNFRRLIHRSVRRSVAPILIHQMGKVGSSSLARALGAIEGLPPVCQIHFLSRIERAKARENFKKWNREIPNHLKASDYLSSIIEQEISENLVWPVVTIVRDPVARQLSDVFQNPEIIGCKAGESPDPIKVLDFLQTYCRNFDEANDYICNWINNEFIQYWNIPVYENPFDEAKQFELIKTNRVRALILRLEDFPNSITNEAVFQSWLQRPIRLTATQENAAASRKSFDSYRQVLSKLSIPRKYLEKVYSSRYSRHFYGESRSQLIQKWSGDLSN